MSDEKPLPRRTPPSGLAAFFERLRNAVPPWELERTARLEAEAARQVDALFERLRGKRAP